MRFLPFTLSLAMVLCSAPALADITGIDLKESLGDRTPHGPFAAPLQVEAIEQGSYTLGSLHEKDKGIAQVSTLGPWGAGGSNRWVAISAPPDLLHSPGLALLSGDTGQSVFSFSESNLSLSLTESGGPVFVFNHGMILPEGVPEDRKRACYFHPVYDLDGRVITDDFPKDHYHHRGIAWMWPGIRIGDRKVDEWHIDGIHQKFIRWLGKEVGPVCAVLGVEAGWFLDDATKKAEEISWYRVFRSTDAGRAIDVHYTLRAVDEPIRIQGTLVEEKGYGGFCIRFGPREDTRITSPQGLEEKDSNRVPYPWVDFSAKFAGADDYSGAAIFVNPGNPGFPNGWTIRHYGFLGVAWPGLDIYTIEPGESFTLQYRIWVHRGDAEEGGVERAWEEYSELGGPAQRPLDEE